MKRGLAISLCLLTLLLFFTSCSLEANLDSTKPQEPEELRAAIEAELRCEIDHDEEGGYQLFYPGSVDREVFHQVFSQSQSYFPVQEGYTLSMQSFDAYKGINTEKYYITGWYLVETGGQKYYLFANLTHDDGGTGIKQWNVFTEEDYHTFLENQKK